MRSRLAATRKSLGRREKDKAIGVVLAVKVADKAQVNQATENPAAAHPPRMVKIRRMKKDKENRLANQATIKRVKRTGRSGSKGGKGLQHPQEPRWGVSRQATPGSQAGDKEGSPFGGGGGQANTENTVSKFDGKVSDGDDPDLDYARKATDLALEYLRDQKEKTWTENCWIN